MLRAANQHRNEADSGHEDTTALLLRIHAIPDPLLFPFSSSDPPSPAGAHLRTGAAITSSTTGPKEVSSQDTIRPSSFPSRQHARSHTLKRQTADLSEDNGAPAGDEIAIWVSLSPCRGHMNITLFEGWRIVVQVPVRDWEDKVYNADDVKRAAMICMGRQLMGEKIICVPIDIQWDFESGEADEDVSSDTYEGERRRSLAGMEDREDSSFRPSIDSSNSQVAVHTRRPSAPEPYTPASTAENGHSPVEPGLYHSSSPSLPTPPAQLTATPAAVSSTWSDSLGNTDSIQDFVTAPDHGDADQDVVVPSRSSTGRTLPSAVQANPTRRTSWIRARFPRIRTRRLLPKLHGAFGKFCRWALGRRTL